MTPAHAPQDMTQHQLEEIRLDRERSDVHVHVDTVGIGHGVADAARVAS
ncbi:MAG: hypothetical protein ABW217_06565 [Polyangiaceae bacterium]